MNIKKSYKPRIYLDSKGDAWKDVLNEDGIYFYNIRTRETTWDKPKDLKETMIVESQNINTNLPKTTRLVGSDYGYGFENEIANSDSIVETVNVPVSDWVCYKLIDGRQYYFNAKTFETSWELPKNLYESYNNIDMYGNSSNIYNINDDNKIDKPILTEPIFGTNWYLVLTSNGKYFYYNHSTRVSTYECPTELEDNLSIEMIKESFERKIKALHGVGATGTSFGILAEARKRKMNMVNKEIENENNQDIFRECKNNHDKNENIINTNDNNNIYESKINNDKIIIDNSNIMNDESVINHDKNQQYINVAQNELNKNNMQNESIKFHLPYTERYRLFNELLDEKKVSAFSTYDSELMKLEKDYRFDLFPAKERKAIFNEYVKQRVDKEREEKHEKIKEKYDKFNDFLKSVVKSSRMSYTDILMKYSSDPRFKIIPKEKERERLFMEYMSNLNKRLVSNESTEDQDGNKKEIFEMFAEFENIDAHTPWRRVLRQIQSDKRFVKLGDSDKCQRFFDEFIEKKVEDEKLRDVERARIEREKASIKQREKNVKMELDKNLNATASKKRSMVHTQAVETFNILLTELINDSEISWHEAKKILKNDERFETSTRELKRDEYLDLFDQHLDNLNKKIVDSYYELLEETGCNITTKWENIYPKIKSDPRCIKFSRTEKVCKNQFFNFIERKHQNAIDDLKKLVSESKMVDHRFLAKTKLIPALYDDLIQSISSDERYKILDDFKEERTKAIQDYLLELQNK